MPKVSLRSRKLTALGLVVVVAVGLLSGCLSTDQSKAQDLLNADRIANSLPALADYRVADAKAQAWAEHLASNPSNPPFLEHSTLTDGYGGTSWCRLGENVGAGPTVDSIEPAFMASPTHRANILNPVYDHVGTGVAVNATSGYVYVVQEFVDIC